MHTASSANAMPHDQHFSDFSAALRYWRRKRGYSQLQLSTMGAVSQRHLSFVESGRAQPSRELILKLGIALEIMMVQWTVTVARRIPADRLARVSSYDVLGTVAAMPAGALVAGPLAASIGVSVTEYGAAVLILAASLLALAPREVRALRSSQTPRSEAEFPRVMAGS